jgi:hypothetical protein
MVCAMQAMPPMGNGVDRTLVAAGQETRARCPTLIAAIAGDLEDGHACTLQIVSTNEALLDRRLGAEEWTAVEDGTGDRGAALLCGWHEEPQAPGNDLGYETQRLELANGAVGEAGELDAMRARDQRAADLCDGCSRCRR